MDTKEIVLRKFYSCVQKSDETVTSFALRPEELFSRACDVKGLKRSDSEHLKQVLYQGEIRPLDDILKIECADGEPLRYLGYIVADINTSVSLPDSAQRSCLFLVVPDTRYSA